jgi:hypothetical protein
MNMEYKKNPVKAIREKCIDCSCGSTAEVKECTVEQCPLFPYRFGKNPFRQKREMTEEQKKAMGDRLREARKASVDSV